MIQKQFKTSIQCNGCLSKVSPKVNEVISESQWSVDLDSDDRILTVEVEEETVGKVISAVKSAGFQIEETN